MQVLLYLFDNKFSVTIIYYICKIKNSIDHERSKIKRFIIRERDF